MVQISGKLDDLDKEVIYLLAKDGRMSVREIAERLESTPPTIRSRIENLTRSGIMRLSALIDVFKTKDLTTAIVGICVERHQELDKKTEQIANLNQVQWTANVTGRFDILAEVILMDGMAGLYRFISEDMPKVGGIRSSESFMVMKSKNKWILLPQKDETERE